MKTIPNKVILAFTLIGIICSCQSKNEADQPDPLSELISSNLLKDGTIDPKLLIGEWDCIKFAYTADGNEILKETALSGGKLTIPVASTPEKYLENRELLWCFGYINSCGLYCSLSGSSIKLELVYCTYVYVKPPHEEYDIRSALMNAYSFVIKGDELIFYFKGTEDKNLLILKKSDNP